MDDLARLLVAVDSRQVEKAADSLDDLAASGGKAEKSVDSLTSKADKQFALLAKGATALGVAFGALKLKDKALDAASLSQRFQELGLSVEVVGKNVGIQNGVLGQTEAKLQSLGISMIKSRQVILKLAASYIDLSKAEELADLARNAAIVGQLNTSDALDRIVNGIRSGESEILKTIGLSVQFGNAYKRMADQLGITSNDLTENQKIIARTNETLRNAPALVGLYEKAMENAGKKFRSTDRLAENLNVKIGALFDSSSVLAAETYTDVLKALDEQVTDLANNGTIEIWGDNLALIFAEIGDSGRAAIATLATLLKAFATASNQLQAILTLNFDDVIPIGDAFINATKERFSNLNKLVDETNARIEKRKLDKILSDEAKSAGVLKKELDGVNDAINNPNGSAGVTADVIKERKEFIKALEEEFEQLGKNNFEIKKMEAANLGASDQADVLIDKIEQKTITLREEEEALRDIERVTDSVATAEERFAERVEELNDLFTKGLGIETYTRAIEQARKEIFDLEKDTKDTTQSIEQFWIQANRNIQSSLSDGFFKVFSGNLDGMVDGVKNTVKRIIAEFAALKTAEFLGFAEIFGGTSSNSLSGTFDFAADLFSSVQSAFTSAGNALGFSASETIQQELSRSDVFGNGNGAGTAFIGGPGTAIGGTGKQSDLVDAVSQGVTRSINQNESGAGALTGSSVGGAGATVEGATFGSVISSIGIASGIGTAAVVALQFLEDNFGDFEIEGIDKRLAKNIEIAFGPGPDIANAVGLQSPESLITKALFGRGPLKQRDTTLTGTLTGEGFSDDASLITFFRSKGGLFKKNKTDSVEIESGGNIITDNEEKLGAFANDLSDFARKLFQTFDESLQLTSVGLNNIAENLNLSTDGLDAFSREVSLISEKGELLTEEQLSRELELATNALTESLLPGLEDFSKAGEAATDTLSRINNEFDLLRSGAVILGLSLGEARNEILGISFSGRTQLVDALGGLEDLSSNLEFFSNNFLSDADQIRIGSETVDAVLKDFGTSLDELSIEGFSELLKSTLAMGEAGAEAAVELFGIQRAFKSTKDAIDQAADSLGGFSDVAREVTQLRSTLVSSYNKEKTELQDIISEFDNLSNTLLSFKDRLRLGELSPLTPGQKLDDARQQFNQTRRLAEGGDADAIAKLPEIAQSFLQASQTFNASGGTFSSDFNLVQSVLDSVGATAKSEADIARLQLTELESSVSKLIDIDKGVASVDDTLKDFTSSITNILVGRGNTSIDGNAVREGTSGTIQESIDFVGSSGINRDQIADAHNLTLEDLSKTSGGITTSDEEILKFIEENSDNIPLIHKTALDFGIGSQRIADVLGTTQEEILAIARAHGLAEFKEGTDESTKTGLALIHKGEAVTPSSVPGLINSLIERIDMLRDDQNRQTDALINVTRDSSKKNAQMIMKSNKESDQSASWLDRSAVGSN